MSKAWPLVKLGEVLEKSQNWVNLNAQEEYKEVTVRLWGKGVTLRGMVTGSQIAGSRRLQVHSNQFILSRIDARNGAFGLIPDELDNAVVSNDFPVFDIHQNRLIPKYLHWLSKTRNFVESCKSVSEGTTNRVRLKEDKFIQIEIPLPPLAEQQRIVAKIERLAGKIEEIWKLKKAIDGEINTLINQFISHCFINKSWPLLTIEECCESLIDYRGRTPPLSDSGIPHITSANIKNGIIDWNTSKFVSEETYSSYMTRGIPRKGDVFFTMEAPLGEAAPLTENLKFSVAQRVLLLRTKPKIMEGEFLSKIITSPLIRQEIYSQSTGTTVKGIASKRLKKILIPIPPLEEQHLIVQQLDKLKKQRDHLKAIQSQTTTELDALLPSILDKAFKGQL